MKVESRPGSRVQGEMAYLRTRAFLHLATCSLVFLGSVSIAQAIKPGAKAPRVSGKSIQKASEVDTKKLRDKVVIVDFWASWCKPCEREIPILSNLAKKHAKDVVVIGVSVDNDVADAKKFIARLRPAFSSVHDATHKSAKAFAPSKMPSTFVIDQKGVIRFVHSGYAPGLAKQLEREIAILKAEKKD